MTNGYAWRKLLVTIIPNAVLYFLKRCVEAYFAGLEIQRQADQDDT
jgi:hypothetical protein